MIQLFSSWLQLSQISMVAWERESHRSTRHRPIVVCISTHHLRCRANIKTTLGQCIVCVCFSEVRAVLLFYALMTLTWLWGGLHMAYSQVWMLVLFCIFNIFTVSIYWLKLELLICKYKLSKFRYLLVFFVLLTYHNIDMDICNKFSTMWR